MKDNNLSWDELHDSRPESNQFDEVVASAMTRRGFLSRVLAVGSGAAVMDTGLANFAITPV